MTIINLWMNLLCASKIGKKTLVGLFEIDNIHLPNTILVHVWICWLVVLFDLFWQFLMPSLIISMFQAKPQNVTNTYTRLVLLELLDQCSNQILFYAVIFDGMSLCLCVAVRLFQFLVLLVAYSREIFSFYSNDSKFDDIILFG